MVYLMSDAIPDDLSGSPKYKQIYAELRRQVTGANYKRGEKLPSENELVIRFGASRPTIGRALAQLESEGFIERRAGSGTYISEQSGKHNMVFGLLIPELGVTEIFEPICKGMSQAHQGGHHDLLWGTLFEPDAPKEIQAERLAEYYLQRSLSGIFFAPLELSAGKDEVNLRIARSFDLAHIPMVLLDRDIVEYPRRSRYDLVCIDNRRAGFVITEHLLLQGARRPLFFARPNSAPTVNQRILGFREALRHYENPGAEEPPAFADPTDVEGLREVLIERRPDAIVCPNDYTAARLMTSLQDLGVHVPFDIKITGMDDIKYASLLHPPLTTIHQPCGEMGVTAMSAMLNRVAYPHAPARDYVVDFQLVVRKSSLSEDKPRTPRSRNKQ
jgi:DNA-binding LacI/PurR family transcriptional regulator